MDKAKKEKPNNVSGLVVKHFIFRPASHLEFQS